MGGKIGRENAANAGLVNGGGDVVLRDTPTIVPGDHGKSGRAAIIGMLGDERDRKLALRQWERRTAGGEEEQKKREMGDGRFQISPRGRGCREHRFCQDDFEFFGEVDFCGDEVPEYRRDG